MDAYYSATKMGRLIHANTWVKNTRTQRMHSVGVHLFDILEKVEL